MFRHYFKTEFAVKVCLAGGGDQAHPVDVFFCQYLQDVFYQRFPDAVAAELFADCHILYVAIADLIAQCPGKSYQITFAVKSRRRRYGVAYGASEPLSIFRKFSKIRFGKEFQQLMLFVCRKRFYCFY